MDENSLGWVWSDEESFSGSLVEDINTRNPNAYIWNIITFEDEIYFQADNGRTGYGSYGNQDVTSENGTK